MDRWEPDAAGRFRAAAIELFGEIGYEQTTVATIAERAGLTARTFFRHFTDKREVLFDGSKRLQQVMLDALAGAPAHATVIDTVAAALAKAGEFFDDERRPFARLRNSVIAANTELDERELIKMTTLTAALAQGLGARGVGETDARLAAEAGIAVLRVSFAQRVSESERRGNGEILNESLSRLRALMAS